MTELINHPETEISEQTIVRALETELAGMLERKPNRSDIKFRILKDVIARLSGGQ